jgi:peptide deformylase
MAVRNIRTDGDEVLRKKSKTVDVVDDKIRVLVNDLAQTLKNADGLGLAGPQVGVLRRVIVVDIGEGLIAFINPVIVSNSGEQIDAEGCLSIPGIFGEVARPMEVRCEGLDQEGNSFSINAEGLLARVICHEVDHLDGILFKDKVIRYVDSNERNGRKKGGKK